MSSTDCPMLKRCFEASRIRCEARKYEECDFFQNLLRDYCEKLRRKCEGKKTLMRINCLYAEKCLKADKMCK